MGLRFIIGRAGSGKTHTCLESIRHALLGSQTGPALMFLVPEQATFQMERALVASPLLRATARAQVLSFRRLAWRVLSDVGGSAREHVGDTGKQMLLRALVDDLGPRLELFQKAASQPGFIAKLSRTIHELRSYRITAGDLARWLSDGPGDGSLLARKVSDLRLVLDGLDGALKGRLLDPDDYLGLLADRLVDSRLVRDAEVWVDGFAGFTPQEYEVLGALMTASRRVHVALCLDPGILVTHEEGDLFHPTWETYDALLAIARDRGVKVERPLHLTSTPRFASAPDLEHLESSLGALPPKVYEGRPAGLRLAAAPSRRAEVEWVAREIIRLVRDTGLRWRDINIMVRHLDRYHHLVSTVLHDYEIPFFMDHKRSLAHHPVVELVRSCLEIAPGWPPDAVFRVLKTDLLPLDRKCADVLENYVLAHGIRGGRWTDGRPWEYRRRFSLVEVEDGDPGDGLLEQVNSARGVVTGVLGPFASAAAKSDQTVSGLARCVYDLMERLDVPGTLERWEEEAREAGNLDLAREHRQVWGAVCELLDQAVAALGERTMTVSGFSRVMESGLESMRLGLIPPSLDQVLVGSIDRSRQPDVQATFVLGVTDGEFPDPCPEDIIFSDAERAELAGSGLDLSPGGDSRLLREQFLAYVAVTRPSRHLYITYPQGDDGGRALLPSTLVAQIKGLFPGLREEQVAPAPAGTVGDVHLLACPARALGDLVVHARRARDDGTPMSPLWMEVYRRLVESPDWRQTSRRVLASLGHHNRVGSLPAPLASGLTGTSLTTSVSRLEEFGSCPFSHFLGHLIRLEERPLHRLEPAHLGSFFHAALHMFTQRLTSDGKSPDQLDDGEREQLLAEIIDQLAPRLKSEILMSSARHRYLTGILSRRLDRATRVLGEHARAGRFRPVRTEMSFGPGADVPPLRLDLSDGTPMLVRGQVDLVEAAKIDDHTYVRVIDYKSGRIGLDLTAVFHGLDLQLPTYLAVVLEHSCAILGSQAEPAGVFHFPVRDPLIEIQPPVTDEEVEERILKALSMKGLALADTRVIGLMSDQPSKLIGVGIRRDGTPRKDAPVADRGRLSRLVAFARDQLRRAGDRIRAGEIAPSPYRRGTKRPCTYCPYTAACGFDVLIDGCGYRDLRRLSRDEFWRAIETRDDS